MIILSRAFERWFWTICLRKKNMSKYIFKPILFHIVSFLMVFFQITGFYIAQDGKVPWSAGFLAVLVIVSLILGIVLSNVLFYGSKVLTEKIRQKNKNRNYVPCNKRKNYLFLMWILLICAWLPFFLAYYPGICSYDFQNQIVQYIVQDFTSHHPILHTLLVGSFWKFGYIGLNDANIGIALYCLLQMLIVSLVFVRGGYLLLKMNCSKKIFWLYAALAAFFPLNGFMIFSVTKDVLFSAFMLLFAITYFEMIYVENNARESITSWMLFIIGAFGVFAFRNNGKYALLAMLTGMVITICLKKEGKKRVLKQMLVVAMICLFASACITMVERYKECKPGDSREMLSVPIQQMARIAVNHKDNMDSHLYAYFTECIDEVSIFDYNPAIADPVKTGTNTSAILGNKGRFLQNYFKMIREYPEECVDAVLALDAGYLYLWDESCAWVNETAGDVGYGYIQTGSNEVFLDSIGIHADSKLLFLYTHLQKWVSSNSYLNNPFIRILISPAIWFYAALYGLAGILQKKEWKLVPFACFMAGYYVTLLLGPTVQMRYIYPMILIEIIFYICIYVKKCFFTIDNA